MLFSTQSLKSARNRAFAIIIVIAVNVAFGGEVGRSDNRGDINLNGVPFEQADVDIFANYFEIGLAAFTINLEAQIAATDVNFDGIVLSVADYVYMVRVADGELDPDYVPTDTLNASISFGKMDSTAVVGLSAMNELGSLELHFDAINVSSCDVAVLPATEGMDFSYDFYGTGLNISLFSTISAMFPTGISQILEINYVGDTLILTSASAVGYYGETVELFVYDSLIIGDINLNLIRYDIADAVLFSNYLVYGDTVFHFNWPLQVLSTDVNGDGTPLTIEDFEYVLSVITGQIDPGDPVGPEFTGEAVFEYRSNEKSAGNILAITNFEQAVGTMAAKFYAPNLSISAVNVLSAAEGMTPGYDLVDDTLSIFLSGFLDNLPHIAPGYAQVLEINYNGDKPVLISSEAAGYAAEPVDVSTSVCNQNLGDCDGTDGLNLLDITYLISYLYLDGPEPVPDTRAADANCDCTVSILDITRILSYLYKNGDAPCSCDDWILDCAGW